MAFTHIQISQNVAAAQRLRNSILGVLNNRDALTAELATMATMIDGDPANAANYTEVVSRYGVEGATLQEQQGRAKALFDEANSLNFKLTTDAQVTSVDAAIKQAANKVR